MRWLWTVLLGAGLGVGAAAADAKADGLDQAPVWLALAMILNAGCVWAALAVLCGRLAVTPVLAALAGSLGLVCAVAGYYLYSVLAGNRGEVGFAGLAGVARYWLVLAAVLGPVLGMVGAGTRRPGLVGLAAALVVPAGAVTEMLVIDRLGRLSDDPVMLWAQLGIVIVSVVIAVAAVARAVRPADRVTR